MPPYSRREKVSSFHNLEGGVGLLITLLNAKSRGSVTLRSSNFEDHPLIDLNLFEDP